MIRPSPAPNASFAPARLWSCAHPFPAATFSGYQPVIGTDVSWPQRGSALRAGRDAIVRRDDQEQRVGLAGRRGKPAAGNSDNRPAANRSGYGPTGRRLLLAQPAELEMRLAWVSRSKTAEIACR